MKTKLRILVTNARDGSPLSGVLVAARVLEVVNPQARDLGATLVAATSDAQGYASVSLGATDGLIYQRIIEVITLGLQTGKSDLAIVAEADPKSSLGVLERFGALGDLYPITAMRKAVGLEAADERISAEWLTEQMFAGGGAVRLTVDGTRLPDGRKPGAVTDPDAIDYELSPASFVNRRPMKQGQGGCEHIVPATLPENVYSLYRLNLRPDLNADPERAAPHQRAETQIASVETDVKPDPRLIFAELLVFEQNWASLGHSLGEIRYSLPLAPGEAMKVAIIDWSRRDDLSREDDIRARERLLHDQTYDRNIADIVRGDVQEQQGGFSAMLGAAYSKDTADPQKGASDAGRIAGGIGGSFTAGSRDMRAESQQDIHGGTLQRTSLQRNLNSTVVIQAGQAEQSNLSTRIVVNMNRMHALTIQYYEVLRHLRVTTHFHRREWALLVPFMPFRFTREMAGRFRNQLEPVLLDPRKAAGFDAIERLSIGNKAYIEAAAAKGSSTASNTMTTATSPSIQVSSYKITIISGPAQNADTWGTLSIFLGQQELFRKSGESFKSLKPTEQVTEAGGLTTFSKTITTGPPVEIGKAIPEIRLIYTPGSLDPNLDGWDINTIQIDALVDTRWTTLATWQPSKVSVPAKWPESAWAITFVRPVDLRNKWDVSREMVVHMNEKLVRKVALPATIDHLAARQVADNYVSAGTSISTAITWRPEKPLPAEDHAEENGESNGMRSTVRKSPPTKESDEVEADLLLNHLNANQMFYNSWSWGAMDRRERRLRLAPAAGRYADGLSDEPIGVIGNHVVVRCSENVSLPNDTMLPELEGKGPPPSTTIVTLPTRGVFAEAHLGHCNGAEVRDITRLWNFDELPVSLLPNIEELRSGQRGTAPQINQAQLPATVVSLQPTPTLPEAQGVAPVITGLGKGDTFRDMSGLEKVSSMVGELIKSAQPPSLEKLLGVKETADKEAAKAKSGSASEGAATTQPPSAGVGISNIADKLRLIDPANVSIPQVLFDLEKSGGTDTVFPPRPPKPLSVPKPQAGDVLIQILPVNAYGQRSEADMFVTVTENDGRIFGPFETGWRSARRQLTSEVPTVQGYLPERLKTLRNGTIQLTITMPPADNGTPLVLNAVKNLRFSFPAGTANAVFEARQQYIEETVEVAAGDTLEQTLGANAALEPSISVSRNATLGGSIKAIEISAGGTLTGALGASLGGNWQEVKNKTWSSKRTFTVRVPLPTIELVQISP